MSDPYEVKAGEHGIVRVFTTDMEPEGAAAVTPQNVKRLLGDGIELNPAKVQVIPSKMLEGMGLSGYLREAHGIAEKDMEGKRAALDALSGLVVLIPSSAFGGREYELAPHDSIRFIGAFREEGGAPSRAMAETESAKGTTPPPMGSPVDPSARSRRSSWIVAIGALIIAAMLVLFFAL